MTKNKSTQHALLLSSLALLMCVFMLIGSTFAWFSDDISSQSNKIVAGVLDVQLLLHDGSDYVDISNSTTPIFSDGSIAQNNNGSTLWEPGKTQVAYLAIKNNGSLALKYSIGLDVKNVSKNLFEVMLYDVVDNAQYGSVNSWTSEFPLRTGNQMLFQDVSVGVGETKYFALCVHMDENAKNEYQGGEVDFTLNILAKQSTAENDTFNNQYDEDADYPVDILNVTNSDELKDALKTAAYGTTILLKSGTYEDLSFTNPSSYTAKNITIIGEKGTVIEGFSVNGWTSDNNIVVDGLKFKNITFSKGILLSTKDMSNVTIDSCNFIDDACIHQNDRTEKLTNLVVKNSTFTGVQGGNTTAIMLENTENVTISGCTFTNIDFNAVQAGVLDGTVLIDNNTINETGDRVFRFVTVNADVTISNNTITSGGDDNGELAKSTNAIAVTLTNNTWNGYSDADVTDKIINITAK